MPLLEKEVITPRVYNAISGGKRIRWNPELEKIKRIAATATAMVASGHKIPAPFGHKKSAKPLEPGEPEHIGPVIYVNSPGDIPQSSYDNAGYWNTFTVKPNDEGIPALFLGIDLPGSDEDTTSLYYKAKHTATQVSLSYLDEYVDGSGKKWKDCMMHCAFVNYPVVISQGGFTEVDMSSLCDVPDGSIVVNMSMLDESPLDCTGNLIGQIVAAMNAKGFVIPADSNASTILRDILVAISQAIGSAGSTLAPTPIYMSSTLQGDEQMQVTAAQAETIVNAKATNALTGKPFTMADFGFVPKTAVPATTDLSTLQTEIVTVREENTKLRQTVASLAKKFGETKRDTLLSRVAALVPRGLSRAIADAQFVPAIDLCTIAEGANPFQESPIEISLSTLEATLPQVTPPAPKGSPLDGYLAGASPLTADGEAPEISKEYFEELLGQIN